MAMRLVQTRSLKRRPSKPRASLLNAIIPFAAKYKSAKYSVLINDYPPIDVRNRKNRVRLKIEKRPPNKSVFDALSLTFMEKES
jgi:hypothetical protein